FACEGAPPPGRGKALVKMPEFRYNIKLCYHSPRGRAGGEESNSQGGYRSYGRHCSTLRLSGAADLPREPAGGPAPAAPGVSREEPAAEGGARRAAQGGADGRRGDHHRHGGAAGSPGSGG